MSETWWTWGQAVSYVLAHYPCDSPSAAGWMIEDMLEYGLLSARYQRADGGITSIEPQEWERSRDDPYDLYWRPPREEAPVSVNRGAILGDVRNFPGAVNYVDYDYDERGGAPRSLASIRHSILVDAAPLVQMCARKDRRPIEASRMVSASKGGRPRHVMAETLLILAGRWIEHQGPPSPRALLEAYLMQVAEDHGTGISPDTAARIARQAVEVVRSHSID